MPASMARAASRLRRTCVRPRYRRRAAVGAEDAAHKLGAAGPDEAGEAEDLAG